MLGSGLFISYLFNFRLYSIWPARLASGDNRSKSAQAGFQFLAVLVTLGMSIVGGLITGRPICPSFFALTNVALYFPFPLFNVTAAMFLW